jgi:hypothetical protein
VQSINGVRPTADLPGPITRRLIQAWNEMVGVDIVVQALSHLDAAEAQPLLTSWRGKVAA